jgi:hypothetical protein
VAGNIQGKAPCYAVQKGTTEIACFFILSWAKLDIKTVPLNHAQLSKCEAASEKRELNCNTPLCPSLLAAKNNKTARLAAYSLA